jgi:hypothetical protein
MAMSDEEIDIGKYRIDKLKASTDIELSPTRVQSYELPKLPDGASRLIVMRSDNIPPEKFERYQRMFNEHCGGSLCVMLRDDEEIEVYDLPAVRS